MARLVFASTFTDQVTLIPRAMSSVLLATGFHEERECPVLVPFVEIMFAGVQHADIDDESDPPTPETIFSRTLSLDNALWLISDMMQDLRFGSAALRAIIDGKASFDPGRMARAQHFAEQVRMQAEQCAALLGELNSLAGSGEARTDKERASKAPEATEAKPTRKLKRKPKSAGS